MLLVLLVLQHVGDVVLGGIHGESWCRLLRGGQTAQEVVYQLVGALPVALARHTAGVALALLLDLVVRLLGEMKDGGATGHHHRIAAKFLVIKGRMLLVQCLQEQDARCMEVGIIPYLLPQLLHSMLVHTVGAAYKVYQRSLRHRSVNACSLIAAATCAVGCGEKVYTTLYI